MIHIVADNFLEIAIEAKKHIKLLSPATVVEPTTCQSGVKPPHSKSPLALEAFLELMKRHN